MTALLVIAILVFLIIVHEFGHFLAAKIFKVRVEEFGIGYPPRAFTLGKLGDTEYTLNWLPFGGFVRLLGEDGEAKTQVGSLAGSSRGIQAVILVAGVAMNAVAAWALFAGALSLGMPRVIIEPDPSVRADLVISAIVPGSPSDNGGLQAGDKIVGIVDTRDAQPSRYTPDDVVEFVRDRGGKSITISYVRNGVPGEAVIIPAHGVLEAEAGKPALGVRLVMVSEEPLSPYKAMRDAVPATWHAFGSVLKALGDLALGVFRGEGSLQNVVGPVGLAGVVGDAARHGLGHIFSLAAFISVNLAIINLLPIPALDGGRLVMLGIEKIMRRNIPHAIVGIVNTVGFAFVILLMLAVTYNDIARLIA